jgi:hypothetical protein
MTKLKRAMACTVAGVAASVTLFIAITALQIEWLGRLYILSVLPVFDLFFWLVPSSLIDWLVPEGGPAGALAAASFIAIVGWSIVFVILAYLFWGRRVLPNQPFEEGRANSGAPLN